MARRLTVEIVGDATSLDRSFKKAGQSAKTFDKQIGRMSRSSIAASGAFGAFGRSLAGAGVGVAVTAGLKSSVEAASDLEQQIGKTNVVFGKSGKEVEAWSKTLAESFGLSQREALTTASTLGALFAPIGLTGDAAAEQSRKLTELGADLASFYNTDVASALDALRSGLVGESEPLRKYGVLLSETRVQQQAMADTGKKTTSALTGQEKVLARLKIIFEDTAQPQGDFARTQGQAAQQAKIFQANLENLKAELGKGLVPALADGTKHLNRFFDAATDDENEWNKSVLQHFQDLRERFIGDRAARHPLWMTKGHPDIPDFPRAPEPFTQFAEIARREAQGQVTEQKTISRLRRQANEAFRQQVQDQLAFAVVRATATAALSDDLAALGRYNALLARRIRGGHSTLELEREQFEVQRQIADVLKQQAEAQKAARTARQFRALGFGPEGQELVPGVKGLQRQLDAVRKTLEGSFLDTSKTRSLIAHIRQVLSGGLGSVSEEVRSRIQEILADLKQQLRQSSVDVTRFQKTARGQFTLAGAHGGGTTIHIANMNLHGIRNVQQLENELAKRKKQRARQRRSTR